METSQALHPESFFSIWQRRVISIPLVLGFAAVAATWFPVSIALIALLDFMKRDWRLWPRTRAVLFFHLYLASQVIGLSAALWIWLRFLGGRGARSKSYLQANVALQTWWCSLLLYSCIKLFSMRLKVENLECTKQGPYLLLMRHSSSADTMLASAVIARAHAITLRIVLKSELLWDPCLDVVGRRLPNAFVRRNAKRSVDDIETVARLADGLDDGSAVLIYPEGTRFSPKKRNERVAALGRTPHLQSIAQTFRHVLPPRLGGVLALFNRAPDKDVVILEHTGLESATTLMSFWRGGLIGKTLHLRLRRFKAETIPANSRDTWLFQRWAEVDDFIHQQKGL